MKITMNCDKCNEALDQYLDDELGEAEVRELLLHVDSCDECSAGLARKKALRQTLKAMRYAPPEKGFYDRMLEETVKTTQKNEAMFWGSAGLGAAMAASVIAWLVLVLPADQMQDIEALQLAGVSISLNVEKTVRVSFESVSELEDATLIVQVPPGVEISGYDSKTEIKWTTDVSRGVNILALPIVVRSGMGGTILARLEHSGKSKTFQFNVDVT